MSTYEIQLAGPQHVEQIADLYIRNWKTAYQGLISQDYLDAMTLSDAIAKWSDYLKQPNHGIFIVMEDGPQDGGPGSVDQPAAPPKLAGFVGFKPYHRIENCIYVYSLHVEEEYRGKGIGTALVNAIAERGRREGYPRMGVCVVVGNENARRLYARMGAQHCMYIDDGFAGDPVKSEVMVWNLQEE